MKLQDIMKEEDYSLNLRDFLAGHKQDGDEKIVLAIDYCNSQKNLGNKVLDFLIDNMGLTAGLSKSIISHVKENRPEHFTAKNMNNAEASRMDRLLRIRTSSGKATARKF